MAKKYNSQALEADALHFSTDIWSSSVVLLGLICANFGFFSADSVAALVVAVIVLIVCYRLGKRSINVLLDRAPDITSKLIGEVLSATTPVKYFHNLNVRMSGADTFVNVNIHLCKDYTCLEAHEICNDIESKIIKIVPRCQVLIHVEPDYPLNN